MREDFSPAKGGKTCYNYKKLGGEKRNFPLIHRTIQLLSLVATLLKKASRICMCPMTQKTVYGSSFVAEITGRKRRDLLLWQKWRCSTSQYANWQKCLAVALRKGVEKNRLGP